MAAELQRTSLNQAGATLLDQAVVEQIAQRLRSARLEPWLDRWSLTPDGKWQRELAAGLDAAAECAVFDVRGQMK
jgi:hypothetical protein